jgi:hypothetical protein
MVFSLPSKSMVFIRPPTIAGIGSPKRKKYESMGEAGFRHGMTPEHLKEIKRLEKENELLKKLLAEKEIEAHLKDELLKKRTSPGSIPGRKKGISWQNISVRG